MANVHLATGPSYMTHYKILFTSEAQNAKFCHFLKRFVTTSKLLSVPKHTKID